MQIPNRIDFRKWTTLSSVSLSLRTEFASCAYSCFKRGKHDAKVLSTSASSSRQQSCSWVQMQMMRVRQRCQLQFAQILESRKLVHNLLHSAMPAYVGLRHTSFQNMRVRCLLCPC